jgi:CheY-like chemotaxis protein
VRSPSRARILIVDDNDDAADLLSLMLEHAGHVTTVAHDGPSALELAPVCDPQIVFLDIGLPGMSGYEVARQLRLDPRFSHTTLVALTGWGTREDKRRAVAAGFDFHLTKPIDARALQSTLDRMGAAVRGTPPSAPV